MAGIKEAMKRVTEQKHEGVVVAKGKLKECACNDENQGCTNCSDTKYIIIRLEHDNGLITQYDYGSDVGIAADVEVGDQVFLNILSNWSAMWEANKADRADNPLQCIPDNNDISKRCYGLSDAEQLKIIINELSNGLTRANELVQELSE